MSQKKRLKNEQKITIRQHLQELRTRIMILIFVFVASSIITFLNYNKILPRLLGPAAGKIILSSPTSSIEAAIKISLLLSFLITLPVFFYQSFRFLEPALPSKSKYFYLNLLMSSFLLAIFGALFAYKITLPNTLAFLENFSLEGTVKLYNLTDYLNFLYLYLAGFALFFQIPIIILAINSLFRLNPKKLLKTQSYAIVLSFLFAGIITPTPDIFNQTIMALPAIMLYELSILLVWLQNKTQ